MPSTTKLIWSRMQTEPFLVPRQGTAAPEAVTTPDVLVIEDRIHLFVGAVAAGTERIIQFTLPPAALSTRQPLSVPSSATTAVSPGPHPFDSGHVFDPAAQEWNDVVYLYYSAVGDGEDTIGLATSANGHRFLKHQHPLLVGRSPEVCVHDGQLYLFSVRRQPGQGYRIYCVCSQDGFTFDHPRAAPALDVGAAGAWDQFEVTTPRIFKRKGWFYMLYAGSRDPARLDLPTAFGIARSMDLHRWERYAHNPVFTVAEPVSWDDGAIWFGTVFAWNDDLYLVYEGGTIEQIHARSPALTQVGLAKVSTGFFDSIMEAWE